LNATVTPACIEAWLGAPVMVYCIILPRTSIAAAMAGYGKLACSQLRRLLRCIRPCAAAWQTMPTDPLPRFPRWSTSLSANRIPLRRNIR
jgi:hypothetical protein